RGAEGRGGPAPEDPLIEPGTMTLSRRDVLWAAAAGALASGGTMGAERIRTRPIPRTGEQVPAIGMGTWRTFDTAERTALVEVVRTLLDAGGAVIDASPM